MNKSVLNQLNEKVKILKKQRVRTAHGIVIYQYIEYMLTWASVTGYSSNLSQGNYSSKISEKNLERQNEIDYKIIMRYRTDLHANDRILYRGRTLEIMNEPIPYDGGRRFICFNAKELVEDKNFEEKEHG